MRSRSTSAIGPTPEVRSFLESAGAGVTTSEDGFVVRTSDVSLVVRQDGGTYVVEIVERGAFDGVHLTTEDEGLIDRFLVLRFAGAWRTAHGMGVLAPPEVPKGDVVVAERRDRVFGLRRPDGTWLATEMLEFDARDLLAALPYAVDVMIGAVQDPRGRPVWGSGSRWRRR